MSQRPTGSAAHERHNIVIVEGTLTAPPPSPRPQAIARSRRTAQHDGRRQGVSGCADDDDERKQEADESNGDATRRRPTVDVAVIVVVVVVTVIAAVHVIRSPVGRVRATR